MTESSINTVVLVVDDSPESLGMLNIALGQADFTTLVALSGVQALSIIDKVEPDIILLDAIMPEMDGFETCKRIKLSHPDIPIIFMTGLSEEENIVKGFEAGSVDYITKPIKPSEVIARIRVHVNNARVRLSTQDALDTTGKHILEINAQAEVVWATQHAIVLMQQIRGFLKVDKTLEQQIIDWLESGAARDRQPLVFKHKQTHIEISFLSTHKDNQLIQLSERNYGRDAEKLIGQLGMTQREAEVLLWISYGKTNREIAQILDISPRTVNKHLETVFRKLNVDNRTAAAAISLKIIEKN